MTMTLSDLNYSYLELDIGGRVEEMRKDMNLYQKRWVLHFRYSCFLWFYGLIIYFWWWDGTIKAITETMMVMLLLKFRFRLWFFFLSVFLSTGSHLSSSHKVYTSRRLSLLICIRESTFLSQSCCSVTTEKLFMCWLLDSNPSNFNHMYVLAIHYFRFVGFSFSKWCLCRNIFS